jgi:hypothetical protein
MKSLVLVRDIVTWFLLSSPLISKVTFVFVISEKNEDSWGKKKIIFHCYVHVVNAIMLFTQK